jgi:Zn-dependent M28 family amino/carboxypeptidase
MVSPHESQHRDARLRADLEALCGDACAGRAPGTEGGRVARALVRARLTAAGLTPHEQQVPGCRGANVIAHVPGTSERWVLVAAHYDHLGTRGSRVYRGADDNAAAVALLLELGRALAARPPTGRGVVLAAFDGEEPPHFLSGSSQYVEQPSVPLDQLDLMVCMDLVGHVLGGAQAPREVRDSLFVLGAEHGEGVASLVDELATCEPAVVARRLDADVIPPLSDYWPFWRRRVPFVFLTCGRSRHYHTPSDNPAELDDDVLAARAGWLERLVRAACAHGVATAAISAAPRAPCIDFLPDGADDAATLRTLRALAAALAPALPAAARLCAQVEALLAECDAHGRAPAPQRAHIRALVGALEQALA